MRMGTVLLRQVALGALSNNASNRKRLHGNVEGKLFVDNSCIDCDTCRWMAPAIFKRDSNEGLSVVHAQPKSAEEAEMALQALVSCPTASIRLEKESNGPENALLNPQATKGALNSFPKAIDEELLAGVYHLGFHSPKSFGATAYLVQTKAHGNIMVDCPRYNATLAERVRKLGGVDYIFLSHKDDVGDHVKWAREFGATRIIHELEVRKSQQTDECEVQLSGTGNWKISSAPKGEPVGAAGDGDEKDEAVIMFTPGHSSGSITLALRSTAGGHQEGEGRKANALFTGDHLAHSSALGRLTLFERYNHHSLQEQLQRALDFKEVDFFESMELTWLLPGHGRRQFFDSREEWFGALDNLAEVY